MVLQIGQKGDILVDPRVVWDQARQTVRHLIDGMVELVTNSDDSYRRIDQPTGRVSITVARLRGASWKSFEVEDEAEGMTLESLIGSLTYGAATSGFQEGLPVRGLWGRGLKETIVALGQGLIRSVHDKRLAEVRVWWDQSEKRGKWEVVAHEKSDSDNGTKVTVTSREESQVKCPEFPKLFEQLARHYALRDIVNRREVWLSMSSASGRGRYSRPRLRKKRVRYEQPVGELVLEEAFPDSPFGQATVRVWEANSPLPFSRWDPCSSAGVIIKSETIPLDISLFGFEEEAGRHFFGEVECPELAERIRNDLSILTTSRTGLDWRYAACRNFDNWMKLVLEPLVQKRRATTSASSVADIAPVHKRALLRELNKIAREELEGPTESEGPGPGSLPEDIKDLIIKPETGYGETGKKRRFSVYLPLDLRTDNEPIRAELFETQGNVSLEPRQVLPVPHPTRSDILWGHLDLTGERLGDCSLLGCSHGELKAVAYFEVNKPAGDRKRNLQGGAGGFFSDIKPNPDPDPLQRVAFDQGVIYYFTEFPVVKEFVLAGKLAQPEGKVLLAEMVSETVCAALARHRLESGLVPGRAEEDIQTSVSRYEAEVNRLKKKCSQLIHRWVAISDVVATGRETSA